MIFVLLKIVVKPIWEIVANIVLEGPPSPVTGTLKYLSTAFYVKWVITKIFYFFACSYIILVNIDLLYGKNSLLLIFTLLNLLIISKNVFTLTSVALLSGRFTKLNTFFKFNVTFSTNLNWINAISSLMLLNSRLSSVTYFSSNDSLSAVLIKILFLRFASVNALYMSNSLFTYMNSGIAPFLKISARFASSSVVAAFAVSFKFWVRLKPTLLRNFAIEK